MKTTLLFGLLAALEAAYGFKLHVYSSDDCSGPTLDTYEEESWTDKWPEDGACRSTRFTQPIWSAKIQYGDSYDDDRYFFRHSDKVVQIFDSENCFQGCRDRHIIAESDRYGDRCISWPMASAASIKPLSWGVFERGRLGSNNWGGGTLAESACSPLQHGDEMTFNGRTWKMQQVAPTWFRDIPAEEWDETVHAKNDTPRFGKHGDVDWFGRYKMWERYQDDLDNVAIERWNSTKHVRWSKEREILRRFEHLVEDVEELCEDVDVGSDFAKQNPKVHAICSWEAGIEKPKSRFLDPTEGYWTQQRMRDAIGA